MLKEEKIEELDSEEINLNVDCLILYRGENEELISAHVVIVFVGEGLLTFLTRENRITIPISRLIKIKEPRKKREE